MPFGVKEETDAEAVPADYADCHVERHLWVHRSNLERVT